MTSPRPTVLRDLGSACPACGSPLEYLAVTGVLFVSGTCGYRRTIAWRDGVITTHEPVSPCTTKTPERGASS